MLSIEWPPLHHAEGRGQRGKKARVALSLQKVDAGPDPLRPFPCLRLLPKTARANSIPVAAVAVVGKYSTRTIPAAEQSSTVALMEKNTVRETNGAYESWLFCLVLPSKKKEEEKMVLVRSGVTVALLPPSFMFFLFDFLVGAVVRSRAFWSLSVSITHTAWKGPPWISCLGLPIIDPGASSEAKRDEAGRQQLASLTAVQTVCWGRDAWRHCSSRPAAACHCQKDRTGTSSETDPPAAPAAELLPCCPPLPCEKTDTCKVHAWNQPVLLWHWHWHTVGMVKAGLPRSPVPIMTRGTAEGSTGTPTRPNPNRSDLASGDRPGLSTSHLPLHYLFFLIFFYHRCIVANLLARVRPREGRVG